MIPVVTPDAMREAERATVDQGVSVSTLMLNAARQIAGWVTKNVRLHSDQQPLKAVALVGPGNNGGDALVTLAELQSDGWECAAVMVRRDSFGEIPADPGELEHIQLISDLSNLRHMDVLIDGIFGNGARSKLSDDVASVIAGAAEQASISPETLFIAIDAPTGVNSLTGETDNGAFRADATLCIGFPKIGLLREPAAEFTGEIFTLDIGIDVPESFDGPYQIDASDVRSWLPRRHSFTHKRRVGSVLIIGGAPTYYGAPRLAAEAAYRAGAGLVALAVPRQIVASIAAQIPEAVFHPISDTDPVRSTIDLLELFDVNNRGYDAVVIGPGIGRDRQANELLSSLLTGSDSVSSSIGFGIPASDSDQRRHNPSLSRIPMVIDADALNWLADHEEWPSILDPYDAVLTPHAGEMARLFGTDARTVVSDSFNIAREAAQAWNQVVVLKCGYACVAVPDGPVWVCDRAPSELATAGTGDVLAGMIGGLIAQGMPPVNAARSAVHIGAVAGSRARSRFGIRSVMATDVIDCIPEGFLSLESVKSFR